MLGWLISHIFWIISYASFSVGTGAGLIYQNWEGLQKKRFDCGDEVLYCAGGVLWPVTWVVLLGMHICIFTYRVMKATAMQLGTRRNMAHIRASQIELREADLARVGGSLELALRYDYKTCVRCLGRGCPDCSGKGVQRVQA